MFQNDKCLEVQSCKTLFLFVQTCWQWNARVKRQRAKRAQLRQTGSWQALKGSNLKDKLCRVLPRKCSSQDLCRRRAKRSLLMSMKRTRRRNTGLDFDKGICCLRLGLFLSATVSSFWGDQFRPREVTKREAAERLGCKNKTRILMCCVYSYFCLSPGPRLDARVVSRTRMGAVLRVHFSASSSNLHVWAGGSVGTTSEKAAVCMAFLEGAASLFYLFCFMNK